MENTNDGPQSLSQNAAVRSSLHVGRAEFQLVICVETAAIISLTYFRIILAKILKKNGMFPSSYVVLISRHIFQL